MPSDPVFGSSRTDRVAKTKLERLITKDELLPDDVRKLILRVARRVEPFELYAEAIDWEKNGDKADLFTLLVMEGGFSPDLIKDIGRLAVKIDEWLRSTSRKMMLRGERHETFLRFVSRVNSVLNQKIQDSLTRDGRLLAVLCMIECGAALRARSIGINIASSGDDVNAYLATIKPSSTNEPDRELYEGRWWQRVSEMPAKLDPDEVMTAQEFADASQVLCGADFAFRQERVNFPVPPVFSHLSGVKCFMRPGNYEAFTSLAEFVVEWDGGNATNWYISRLNCHVHLATAPFLPYDQPFEHFHRTAAYEYLRRASVAAILDALERGEIQEESYVGGEDIVDRLAMLELERELTVVAKPLPSVSPAAPEAAVQPRRTEEPLTLDLACSMGQGKRVRRERAVVRTGALSWRRIMGALKRCGASVDLTTRHPKLIRGNRTAGFLNRHSEEDLAFNRQILYATLAELDISLDSFYRAL